MLSLRIITAPIYCQQLLMREKTVFVFIPTYQHNCFSFSADNDREAERNHIRLSVDSNSVDFDFVDDQDREFMQRNFEIQPWNTCERQT